MLHTGGAFLGNSKLRAIIRVTYDAEHLTVHALHRGNILKILVEVTPHQCSLRTFIWKQYIDNDLTLVSTYSKAEFSGLKKIRTMS